MDTLIILALLVTLSLFYFFPKRIFGPILFGIAWIAVVLLFASNVTSPLDLNF